jgi:hypothetical protein
VTTNNGDTFHQRMDRIETMIQTLEKIPNEATRELVRDLIRSVLELHANGFSTLLDRIVHSHASGKELIAFLAEDALISQLLLLHNLHPVPVETRVQQALDKVEPYLRSQGVQLQSMTVSGEAVVTLHLESAGRLPSMATAEMRNEVAGAILSAAPDVADVVLFGLREAEDFRLPLPVVSMANR